MINVRGGSDLTNLSVAKIQRPLGDNFLPPPSPSFYFIDYDYAKQRLTFQPFGPKDHSQLNLNSPRQIS